MTINRNPANGSEFDPASHLNKKGRVAIATSIGVVGLTAMIGGLSTAVNSETLVGSKGVTIWGSELAGDSVYNTVNEILDKKDIEPNIADNILGTLDYGAVLSVTPNKINNGQEFEVSVSKNGLGIHAIKLTEVERP